MRWDGKNRYLSWDAPALLGGTIDWANPENITDIRTAIWMLFKGIEERRADGADNVDWDTWEVVSGYFLTAVKFGSSPYDVNLWDVLRAYIYNSAKLYCRHFYYNNLDGSVTDVRPIVGQNFLGSNHTIHPTPLQLFNNADDVFPADHFFRVDFADYIHQPVPKRWFKEAYEIVNGLLYYDMSIVANRSAVSTELAFPFDDSDTGTTASEAYDNLEVVWDAFSWSFDPPTLETQAWVTYPPDFVTVEELSPTSFRASTHVEASRNTLSIPTAAPVGTTVMSIHTDDVDQPPFTPEVFEVDVVEPKTWTEYEGGGAMAPAVLDPDPAIPEQVLSVYDIFLDFTDVTGVYELED